MTITSAGYLTSNANTAWPFVSDQPGLTQNAVMLFADGAVTLKTHEQGARVFINNILIDKIDNYINFSFTAYKSLNNKDYDHEEFELHIQEDSGVYTSAKCSWCFFIIEAYEVLKQFSVFGKTVYPENLELSPSVISVDADKVTSISLWNHSERKCRNCDPEHIDDCDINDDNKIFFSALNKLVKTHDNIRGPVKIVPGYNMYVGNDPEYTLTRSTINIPKDAINLTGTDKANSIILASNEGLGRGTVPCRCEADCNDTNSNIHPDSIGNVIIETDECFQISADGKIKITGRCTACCQCESFVEIGDRLASQNNVVTASYTSLINSSKTYNTLAEKFNNINSVMDEDLLIVKCVASAQKIDSGAAHSLQLTRIDGSVDRAHGVLAVINASSVDVSVSILANMYPQPFALAAITKPIKAENFTVNTTTETVSAVNSAITQNLNLLIDEDEINLSAIDQVLAEDIDVTVIPDDSNDSSDSNDSNDSNDPTPIVVRLANYGDILTRELIDTLVAYGITAVDVLSPSPFVYSTILPASSTLSIRLYGAKKGKSPSSSCSISGVVSFLWNDGINSCTKTFNANSNNP